MLILNKSTKKYLARDLKFAQSFFDKSVGLLSPKNPRSIMFFTRFGIHTFFLKETIDVLILDNKYKVIKIKTLKPFSVFVYSPRYKIVLEVPAGTVNKTKTKIGDQLKVLEANNASKN